MTTLHELMTGMSYQVLQGSTGCSLAGITADSREVRSGWAFVAIPGTKVDGHAFAPQAVRQGASALVLERPLEPGVPLPTCCIRVSDARKALAHLATAFYGHPSRQLRLIGVTGTNGKTTSTYLLESVFQAHGLPPGVIGTVSYRYAGREQPSVQTTPAPQEIQHLLRQMVDAGVSVCAMEVSSHALAQHRVWGCQFAAALFTNLTQDHLDYHREMAAYYAAKAQLFTTYQPDVAVLNYDDPAGIQLLHDTHVPVITYGFSPAADVSVAQLAMAANGMTLTVRLGQQAWRVCSWLVGRHNVYNILGVLATANGLGLGLEETIQGVQQLRAVPGRFEPVDSGQPFGVLVDYAHTEDALRNVLEAARGLTSGRVIVVFGAGGDRDPGKRSRMGQVAARCADLTVITSDNPRTECPMVIIRAIELGFREIGPVSAYSLNEDRRSAIYQAIGWARPGDVVVIAGKGHEAYQIVGDQRFPFDDREVAREALGAHGYTLTSTAPQ
jgi:UDP-N-acetylmuramoyl-L-alanyl-D-glutamate--2,6-diaminopimelate ligase